MIDSKITKLAIACKINRTASIYNSLASILINYNGVSWRTCWIFRNGSDAGTVKFVKAGSLIRCQHNGHTLRQASTVALPYTRNRSRDGSANPDLLFN